MTSEGGDREKPDSTELSADELFEQLEPFEPYSTDELADDLAADRGVIRRLLDKLNGEGRIKRKKPKSSPNIWVREPPVNSCSECGREFEVKFMHSVLSSVQFCPRCGKQV